MFLKRIVRTRRSRSGNKNPQEVRFADLTEKCSEEEEASVEVSAPTLPCVSLRLFSPYLYQENGW
jgi:hypothetical protein